MKSATLGLVAGLNVTVAVLARASEPARIERIDLSGSWEMQSAGVEGADGGSLSQPGHARRNWYPVQVPTTVLNALVKRGVYPDPRFGLNTYQIPDSSDEFNQTNDLAKYSHLPDKRNPWRDPWWFRREFTLPKLPGDRHVWLHFDSINYRAEVWLNGNNVAGREEMVSMNQRFAFEVSRWAVAGANCLTVRTWGVDHVGSPGPQLVPLAANERAPKITAAHVNTALASVPCVPGLVPPTSADSTS